MSVKDYQLFALTSFLRIHESSQVFNSLAVPTLGPDFSPDLSNRSAEVVGAGEEVVLKAPAIRNRGYTDETHLRGFERPNFWLVRAGGLCLCSSELYSPKTFQTSSNIIPPSILM